MLELDNLSEEQVSSIYKEFIRFDYHKKRNMLAFMEWDKYPQQGDFRTQILDRLNGKTSDKKIFVVFGGNRSGKTELGAGIVAEALEKIPDFKCMAATVDYKLSVQVQQSKVDKLMKKSIVKYGHYNQVRGYTREMLTTKNGGKCIFRTFAQGRESIQGMDLDLVWIDEECPWDFFQEALARTTDRDGVLLFTFTSLSGYTHLVNFLWESKNKLVATTVLSMLDNPFIPQSAKDTYLLTVDEDEVQSRVYGKPHLKQGLIYKEFGKIHKVERFDYVSLARGLPRRYEIHEGIDPHERTPHHWMRFLYDRETNKVYIVEELKAPCESMLIKDFARMIKAKRNGFSPEFTQIDTSSMIPNVIYRHPDEDQANVHTVRLEFTNCGIETILCTKDNAMGLGAVKERLKMVKTKEGVIKRHPLLYVFDDCDQTIWEFTRYSWDSYGSPKISEKKEIVNKPLKKNDHFMDILKYECIKLKLDVSDEPLFHEAPTMYDKMGY